jgi:hypothetical protein
VADKREAFAAKLLSAIQRAGLERSRYLPEAFEIEVEGGGRLNLENALVDYERAGFFARGEVVRRWVAFARESASADGIPKSIDDARRSIVPLVRDRAYFANMELAQKARGAIRSGPVEVLGGDLAVSLAYDGRQMIVGLAGGQFDVWGISVEEAHKIARANIRARTPDGLRQLRPGLHVSPYRDSHDCGRIVLTEVIARLPMKGDPVAFVPNRDTLIVTGSDDPENLVEAAKMAMTGLEDPRFLSGCAVCFRSGQWQRFLPAPGSPAHEPLRRLTLKTQRFYYEEQRELLQKQEGETTFIGIFDGGTEPTGEWFSWATWAESITTWLPVVDKLVLFSEWTKAHNLQGPWKWSVVADIAGGLMHPKETVPLRMFVNQFPAEDMVRAIARAHES